MSEQSKEAEGEKKGKGGTEKKRERKERRGEKARGEIDDTPNEGSGHQRGIPMEVEEVIQ